MAMTMKASIILVFLLVPLFSFAANNGNHVYPYEPSIVSLSGRVYRQTFPGRPNYQNVKEGDEPERHWVLNLETPISVMPAQGKDLDGLNIPEHNIRKIQIVIMSKYPFRFRNGKRYKVSGSLFHAISGHHHTPVLIELKKAENIK